MHSFKEETGQGSWLTQVGPGIPGVPASQGRTGRAGPPQVPGLRGDLQTLDPGLPLLFSVPTLGCATAQPVLQSPAWDLRPRPFRSPAVLEPLPHPRASPTLADTLHPWAQTQLAAKNSDSLMINLQPKTMWEWLSHWHGNPENVLEPVHVCSSVYLTCPELQAGHTAPSARPRREGGSNSGVFILPGPNLQAPAVSPLPRGTELRPKKPCFLLLYPTGIVGGTGKLCLKVLGSYSLTRNQTCAPGSG